MAHVGYAGVGMNLSDENRILIRTFLSEKAHPEATELH